MLSKYAYKFVGLGFKRIKIKLFLVLRIEKNVRYAIICPFTVLFNDKRYIQLIIKIQFSELYSYRIMIFNKRK